MGTDEREDRWAERERVTEKEKEKRGRRLEGNKKKMEKKDRASSRDKSRQGRRGSSKQWRESEK